MLGIIAHIYVHFCAVLWTSLYTMACTLIKQPDVNIGGRSPNLFQLKNSTEDVALTLALTQHLFYIKINY